MAISTLRNIRGAELAFDAISIEGGLLAADWLTRVAQLRASHQDPSDYGIHKGLELRDEIGRYWRIAQAHWSDFIAGREAKAEPFAVARRFTVALLRDAFGFTDLAELAPSLEVALVPGVADVRAREAVLLGGHIWPLAGIDSAGRVPLVCAPAGAGLDTPHHAFGDGHRKRSAFGLVQEFLNTSDDALWGVCADGLTLRLVRDNASLTRPAWVEFDLGRIFTEDLYPDFAAAWLLLHRSRFGRAADEPESCPLEVWRSAAREEGTLARARLREGFEEALLLLGQGFLAHSANQALRKALHDGTLKKQDYFGQLLRLVYRLIFLLAVEERGLLHSKDASKDVKERYAIGYSLQRLRDRSARRAAHDRHSDVWTAVKIVFGGLATGEPGLGLPALAGLFVPSQCPDLDAARLENRALLGALFRLCWLREPTGLARVNWRDMGSDELGYVYEGLLELVPQITQDGRTFSFAGRDESRGNNRKTTGSYYTPDSLVDILLDSALDPVIAATVARNPDRPIEALLSLAIVDPACGSGHFLLAAARRLAERVARLKSNGTPTPEDYRHALRQVVGRCIYGVDLNPLAVELCKVALWMEAVDPGLPLTFLDSHIRQGNALLGTSHALMSDGVPDEAWVALEGDELKVANSLKRRNRAERGGQRLLPLGTGTEEGSVREAVNELESTPDTDTAWLAQKEARWKQLLESEPWRHTKLVYDAWCAAFLWPKTEAGSFTEAAPTAATWRTLADGERPSKPLVETIDFLARDYAFFHWELAFPGVFERGGFDVVLGNPPWERVKLQELEFFASRDDAIAGALNAAERKKVIAELPVRDPDLWEEWSRASRVAQGTSHFVRQSGRYPLCGKGDVNTYALFAEHNWHLLGPRGRAGFIVPSGIATDDTTKDYFQAVVRTRALHAMWEFENEGFFTAGKGHMLRFALTTLSGREEPSEVADFMFQGQSVDDLDDPLRHFALSAEDIETINPNTGTCPIFRTQRDAHLSLSMYRRAGVLWREGDPDGNPWGLRFMTMFHMANDSGLFRTRGELAQAGWDLEGNRFMKDGQVMLPLYEAKMAYLHTHRSGTFEAAAPGERPHRLPVPSDAQLEDPYYAPLPFYWVRDADVKTRLDANWDREWLLGWRDVTDARASVRAVIAFVLPKTAVGHTTPLFLPSHSPRLCATFLANLSSIPLDFAARQKIGGLHLTYSYLRQFPVLKAGEYADPANWDRSQSLQDWIALRFVELAYTAWDLQPFARDCGYNGAPYIWDPIRRFQLQCELDAAFFHLYGISRDDAEYILGTFDVLERADLRVHKEFRTRRVVLECYDALAYAAATGQPYISPLAPPKRAECQNFG
ncbi:MULTISPECIES: Eco57I restriction-modification methylase domain-containing protein [Paraburkholderia]|uniref:site-specific DNA-methyltransferase (adenine-specific) n=1 Tax=Paraburkholderia podalyriae TaxID=1938811 RepID=A0ABR7PFE4_9BURK|nr:N-6 DNA methylase [Paraburkholderia podalyriae]MBC8745100.1 N-6 DNA methylase [Paraburkholderia podalyriae]